MVLLSCSSIFAAIARVLSIAMDVDSPRLRSYAEREGADWLAVNLIRFSLRSITGKGACMLH